MSLCAGLLSYALTRGLGASSDNISHMSTMGILIGVTVLLDGYVKVMHSTGKLQSAGCSVRIGYGVTLAYQLI